MTQDEKRIASEILIAALAAKAIIPAGKNNEERAVEIAESFKIIAAAVDTPI
jgi:hypothetical protein